MNANLREALHIVSDESAADILKATLGIPHRRILISEDPLVYGPAPATHDLSHWRLIREEYLRSIYLDWPGFSMDQYAGNGLLSNTSRLAGQSPIVVWVSPSLQAQLLLAWLTVLLDHHEPGPARLQVVQFTNLHAKGPVRSIAALSPESLQQNMPVARPLARQEIDEYQLAWKTYTSSDAIDLMRFLNRNPHNEMLFAAMRHLVYRYPSVETGLCAHDEILLRSTQERGPEAVRIIAEAMAANDNRDAPGESYLFHRLRKLGHPFRNRPLLTLSGDEASMFACGATLTAYGEEILEGRSGALETDDIDDWVGGVRLDRTTPIPFRIKDELYLPV
ncbi:MAG TPA: DUF1835 domain-containing protein [Xanthomonadales bacterium]